MANLGIDLGVLEHKLHQAHRNAVQAELNAAGLQEVGHPLLLCILRSAGDRCPDGQVQAQRELSSLLDISPAAVATSLKSLEKKRVYPPGARARRRPAQPGEADRQGPAGGGRLLCLFAAGKPADVRRLHYPGADPAPRLLSPGAGEPASGTTMTPCRERKEDRTCFNCF